MSTRYGFKLSIPQTDATAMLNIGADLAMNPPLPTPEVKKVTSLLAHEAQPTQSASPAPSADIGAETRVETRMDARMDARAETRPRSTLKPAPSAQLTRLKDLLQPNARALISYITDSAKQVRKCVLSTIPENKFYEPSDGSLCCFWDRNPLPAGIYPVGCPVGYVHDTATKIYVSGAGANVYRITEFVTPNRFESLTSSTEHSFELDAGGFYYTDGVFCSFNCCMAFIQERVKANDRNYLNSERLLKKMYLDLIETNPLGTQSTIDIIPAADWRKLVQYGGDLTIAEYRGAFSRLEFVSHGLTFISSGEVEQDTRKKGRSLPVIRTTATLLETQVRF